MIAFLRGTLVEKSPECVILDVNGCGYQIFIPQTISSRLPSVDTEIKLWTYHHIREDVEHLYGFFTPAERDFFLLLISASGFGPRTALKVLSNTSSAELKQAILKSDLRFLSSLPGLGKRTAEKLVVELKGKVKTLPITEEEKKMTQAEKEVKDAVEGLMALGYKRSQAEEAIKSACERLDNKATAQHLIKEALRFL